MWLQVMRVSNISSADGKFLCHECMVGILASTHQSSYDWPRQGRPPKGWWTLWKKKMQLVFSCDGASLKLRRPLGQWNTAMKTDEWEIVHSAMSGQSEIFRRQQDGDYEVYIDAGRTSGKHTSVSSLPCGRVDRIPDDAVPASLGPRWKDGKQRVIFRQRKPSIIEQDDVNFLSFEAYLNSQDEHIRKIFATYRPIRRMCRRRCDTDHE
jgi:hypothetical protein